VTSLAAGIAEPLSQMPDGLLLPHIITTFHRNEGRKKKL
jgi:hypothetical protein